MEQRQTKVTKWRAYSELAWTESIIAPPDDYVEETEPYVKAINRHSKIKAKTLLHLGCGAGGHDYVFKKYFKVTGVDISEDMLKIARNRNPEVVYHYGDMRTIRLTDSFDAVAIPDSIGYMTTIKDLERAITTAYEHLKPGGALLIVADIAEEFEKRNFVYAGSSRDIDITIFENHYIPGRLRTTYEVTLIYLIRRKGTLEVYTDCHVIGTFKLNAWLRLLSKVGFTEVQQARIEDLYAPFIMGENEYPLRMFIGIK
jgi:SAM-dependent methyltransferase